MISLNGQIRFSGTVMACMLGSTFLIGQIPLDERVNVSTSSRLMSRETFRKSIMNKTAAEVKRLIGPPDFTSGDEGNDNWAYQHEVAYNEATGNGSYAVLIFRRGRVAKINFVG